MNNIILSAIIIIISFILILILNKTTQKENDKIISNGSYTIGTVSVYSSGKGAIIAPKIINSPSNPPWVKYTYTVNNKIYNNRYNAGNYKMPFEGVNEGERYLVVYKKDKPEKSLMLFDYPIRNDSDFEKYMEEFKKHPPNLKW
ncbi:MAG: hypothetical protein WC223_01960 [Bacteroidales bacterium]|jgi:hypothetical protein